MEETDPKTLASYTASRSGIGRAEVPSKVGRYEIAGVLGHGAMGVVLNAYDPILERRVALKILALDPSPRRRAAMLREAQALARLADPAVVTVHDVGEVVDRIFVAMELVEGRTLRDALADGAVPWATRLRWLVAAGAGLASAHEAGVVHGDFKPANVMVGDAGVRVVDFGLARLAAGGDDSVPVAARAAVADSLARQTNPDAATVAGVGTPAYMSPEQWSGDAADARSDQFAFCVTAWEALFGERPFSADSLAEATLRAARGQLNRPSRSPVPARVRRALERGLAADPKRRWPSMRVLLAELSPPSRRSWWMSIATLGALFVTVLWLRPDVAVGRPVAATTEALVGCADARPLDTGWSPETRAQIERALVATGLPYASGTAERLPQHLARWHEASALAQQRLCVALALPSSTDLDPARARECLASARDEMSALIDGWRTPDRSAIEHAIPTALNIEPPTRCLDVRYLHERDQLEALPEAHRAHAKALLARMRLNLGERPVSPTPGDLDSMEKLESAFLEAQRMGLDEYAAALAVTWLRRAVLTQVEPETLARSVGGARAAVARLPEPSMLSVYYELTMAEVDRDRGDLDASVARLAAVVERAETLWGPEHPETGRIWLNLATAQSKAKDSDAARRSHRRGVEILERTLGPDHPHTVVTRLAGIVATEESEDVHREAYEHALGVLEAAYDEDAVVVAMTRDNLADLLNETDPARAERLHHAALATWRARGEAYAAFAGRSESNIGVLYTEQGRFDEAIAAHRRAVAVLEEHLGPAHADTQLAQARLADAIEAAD